MVFHVQQRKIAKVCVKDSVSCSRSSIRPVSFHIIQKNVNLATSLYFCAKSEFIIAAQTFSSLRIEQMRFGTNYNVTLNLPELLSQFGKRWSGPVQTLKSVWGCYFDVQIVPGFLFLRFCGNLKSQGKMLL